MAMYLKAWSKKATPTPVKSAFNFSSSTIPEDSFFRRHLSTDRKKGILKWHRPPLYCHIWQGWFRGTLYTWIQYTRIWSIMAASLPTVLVCWCVWWLRTWKCRACVLRNTEGTCSICRLRQYNTAPMSALGQCRVILRAFVIFQADDTTNATTLAHEEYVRYFRRTHTTIKNGSDTLKPTRYL